MGDVFDGSLGVVLRCVGIGEGQLERTSWVLWFNRAPDGEVGELIDPIDEGETEIVG